MPPLTKAEIRRVQEIVGNLLYYGQAAVDPTLLAALRTITSHQSNGTQVVETACNDLLDYVATHSNAGIDRNCDVLPIV